MEIRNIAIIAHVDHGKTTLTDEILEQTGMTSDGASMDSDAQEQERGITIYAKNTSCIYNDTKINILDTPGHADFGSEVERVLRSIDSVLLVVDAAEGPMPQTKFVLKKSLELGLKPILVLNKIDKPAADVDAAHDAVFDLFAELGATDEQLDFTTVYAIGRDGVAKREMSDELVNLNPILDVVLEQVPAASGDDLKSNPLQAQVFNLAYDNFLGRMGVARIYNGVLERNKDIFVKKSDGSTYKARITKLFTFHGMTRTETDYATAGDIVMLAGIEDIYIGDTLVSDESTDAMPEIRVDEPTIAFNMFVNDSPFAGRGSAKYLTSRQIRDRLEKELEINVGLQVDFTTGEDGKYKVFGRGEMHLAVLIENMRREGYELAVSPPQAIVKEEGGEKTEPFEEVTILVPESASGTVIEKLGLRKGVMTNMVDEGAGKRLIFEMPTRGLLGYRNEFVIDTKGEGILTSLMIGFRPYAGNIIKTERGSMISMAQGKALDFSLANLQERGTLYIAAGDEIYEGMVVGNTSKGEDMVVNPTKGKQLTNMRASGSDGTTKITPPMDLTLEKALGMMRDDEYLEITPEIVRLRKAYLTETERKKNGSKV